MKKEFVSLKVKIDEFKRTTQDKAKDINYVDFDNNLDRIKGRSNLVVYGRRGSGKTVLLTKGTESLSEEKDKEVIYIQCETYKKHSYPNLLINILINIFNHLNETIKFIPFTKRRKLKQKIGLMISELKKELDIPDEFIVQQGEKEILEKLTRSEISLSKGISLGAQLDDKKLKEIEKKYNFVQNKINKLNNHIDDFRNILNDYLQIMGINNLYLMFDDYYHLGLSDQPFIVDYIFSLCKDLPIYLKITTIRHRTNLYIRDINSNIRGIQEGADHSSIDLDYSLEQFEKTSNFLKKILRNLTASCNINNFENYFVKNENGIPRLVWASGGVPRDFLILIGHLLNLVDEGNIVFDKGLIDKAASLLFQEKLQDLNSDYAVDRKVKEFYEKLRQFNLIYNKKTCFLIKEDNLSEETKNKINNLMDHRLIHRVASNISLTKHRGPFIAYILDMGSYSNYLRIKKNENKISEINILRRDPYKKDAISEIRALGARNELTDDHLRLGYDFCKEESKKVKRRKVSKEYGELLQKTLFDY